MKKLLHFIIGILLSIFNYAQVILPTNSTIWTKGKSAEIRWTQSNYSGNVKITLERGEVQVKIITSSTINNGTFTWSSVPTDLTTVGAYYVKVEQIGTQPFNRSEAFSIQDPAPSKPTVTTYSATNINTNSACLNGKVNPNGAKTTWYFKYSTDQNLWTNYGGSSISADKTEENVQSYFSGLKPGTKYYYKLVASNSSEPVEGVVKSFTTQADVTSSTPIKSATIKYYRNGVQQSISYNPGMQESIYPDAGTKVDISITKSANVASPATFYVFDSNNPSYSKNKSSNLTTETFYNCAGPLDTDLLLTVNTNEGGIRVKVYWSKPATPDLSISTVTVDGVLYTSGMNFLVGQTVNIQGDVWNMGKTTAVASKLGLFLKNTKDDVTGTPIKINDVPAINSGLGSSQQFSYTFTTADVGDKYFVLKADNTNLVNEGTLEGNNISSFGPFKVSSPANLSLSKTALSFGNTNINGCSTEQECILKNNGTTTITGTAYIVNTTHFTFTSGGGSFSLAAGASKSIKVKFCPVSVGSQSTILKIVVDGTTAAVAQTTLTGAGASVPETIIGYSNDFLFDTKKELAKTGGIYLQIKETGNTHWVKKVGYKYGICTQPECIRTAMFDVDENGVAFLTQQVSTGFFDYTYDFADEILLFDVNNKLIGHIPFEYSFKDESMQARQAILFLHNDEAICENGKYFPYTINNPNNPWPGVRRYDYYSDGEFPVSMLIPPHVFDGNISRGFVIPDKKDKTPVLFIHGVTGTYSSAEKVANVTKTTELGDQVSYWFDTPAKVNLQGNKERYHAWQLYYPPEDDNTQCGLMVKNAVNFLYDFYSRNKSINLVTHSMGGLITMDYLTKLTNDELLKIGKILLIEPPIHGSRNANLNYQSLQGFTVGDWFGKDGDAPAYRDLSIGSNFLVQLFSKNRIWSDELIQRTFVVFGMTNKGLSPDWFKIEAYNHSDGVVSLSSASLLDKGIGFVGFYGNHTDGKYSAEIENKNFLKDLIDKYLILSKESFLNECKANNETIEIVVDGKGNVLKPSGQTLNSVKSERNNVNYQKGMVTIIDKAIQQDFMLYFNKISETYQIGKIILNGEVDDYEKLGQFKINRFYSDEMSNMSYYFEQWVGEDAPFPINGTGFRFSNSSNECSNVIFYDSGNFPNYMGKICRKNLQHQYLVTQGTQTKAATIANQETPVKKISQLVNSEFSGNQIFIDNQTSSVEFILYGETAFNNSLKYGVSLIRPDGTKVDSTSSNIVYTNDPYTSVKKITIQNPLPGEWKVFPVIDPSFQVTDFITKAKLASAIVAKSAIEAKNPVLLSSLINVPDASKMNRDSLVSFAIISSETGQPDTIKLTSLQVSGNDFTLSKSFNPTNDGSSRYTLITTGVYNGFRFERAVYGSFTVENNKIAFNVPDVELNQTNSSANLKLANYLFCNSCNPDLITYKVSMTESSFIEDGLVVGYSPESKIFTASVGNNPPSGQATFFVDCFDGSTKVASDTFRISYTQPGIPVDLAASLITRNSATVSWKSKGTEPKWDIKYGIKGFNPETGGVLINNVTAVSFKLEGLQQGANYDFYVRAVYAENEKSAWSWPGSFVTNHIITVTSLSNGTSTPKGENEVSNHGNFEVAFVPNPGYEVGEVIVDGNSIGAVSQYLFNDVIANHTVIVSFQKSIYNVSASVFPANTGMVSGSGKFSYGETVNLTAQPANGFKFTGWSENFAVISTNPSISFTAQKNVTLQANFSSVTGINEIETGELLIYPNPTNNWVNIQMKGNRVIQQIQVYNVLGQMLLNTKTGGSGNYGFDVKTWLTGMYLIQISTDKEIFSEKFSVVK